MLSRFLCQKRTRSATLVSTMVKFVKRNKKTTNFETQKIWVFGWFVKHKKNTKCPQGRLWRKN